MVELVGDSRALTKSFDNAGNAARDMAGDFDKASGSARSVGDTFDAAGEKSDRLEQRSMGFRDTITGLQDSFKALTDESLSMEERLLTLGMGVGDLASGFANLIFPMLKVVAQYAATGVAAVASSAKQVAAWALLGVQSTLNAAKVAAAWLIAMGPIGAIIAAVTGLVALIILNWDKIKGAIGAVWNWLKNTVGGIWNGVTTTIRNAISGAVNFVKDAFNSVVRFITGLPGRIASAAGGLFDGIKNAFKGAINWIIRAWNGIGFTIPSFEVPFFGRVGGFTVGTPDLPLFHQGGFVPGPAGSDVPIMAQAGEYVVPRRDAGSRGTIVINIESFVGSDRDIDKFADRLAMRLRLQGV